MTACQQANSMALDLRAWVSHPAAHNPPPPQTAAPALPDTSSQQGLTGRNRPAHSPPTHTCLDERQLAGETAAAGAGAHTRAHRRHPRTHTATLYCSMLCSAFHGGCNTHGGTGGRAPHTARFGYPHKQCRVGTRTPAPCAPSHWCVDVGSMNVGGLGCRALHITEQLIMHGPTEQPWF